MTTAQAPRLDRRGFQEIVDAVLAEARGTAGEWDPTAPGDVGFALVAIYAHFTEILLDRLNRVPQKNLLAFLDLMGVSLLPPGAARAPLVFTLSPGAGEAGFVPRRTQVATTQTETEPAVVFETQADLTVVAAQLVRAFSIDPERDRYADRSAAVRGEDAVVYDAFSGDRPIVHAVYLGLDPDRPVLDEATGRLVVEVDSSTAAAALLGLEWTAWRGGEWQPLPTPELGDSGPALVFAGARGPDAALELTGLGLRPPVARRWLRGAARAPVSSRVTVGGIALRPQLTVPVTEVWFTDPGAFPAFVRVERRTQFLLDERGQGMIAVSSSAWTAEVPRIHISVELRNGATLPDTWESLQVAWDYLAADGDWRPLGQSTWWNTEVREALAQPIAEQPPTVTGTGFSDTTEGFRRSGWVSFPRPNDFKEAIPEREGIPDRGRWVRATPSISSQEREGERVTFRDAPVLRSVMTASDVAPTAAAAGTALVDPHTPTLPFGAVPQPNAVFSIASREALAQPGAHVTLFVSLNPAGRPAPRLDFQELVDEAGGSLADVSAQLLWPFRMVWEYSSAGGWKVLGESRLMFRVAPVEGRVEAPLPPATRGMAKSNLPFEVGKAVFVSRTTVARPLGLYPWVVSSHDVSGLLADTTEGLRRSGEIAFVMPEDVAPGTVAGVESYWIRARIAEGDYGALQEFVLPPARAETVALVPKIGTGTLRPPTIESLGLAYDYRTASISPAVVTLNELRYRDLSGVSPADLLVPPDEDDPTFYLGFDRELPNTGVSLYFAVAPRQVVERLPGLVPVKIAVGESTDGAVLAWEYWNGTAWAPLAVTDDTKDLTESGRVELIGPADAAPLALFEEDERYWIRIRLVGSPDPSPRLDGVFLNAVEALQATTVENETVGSSNGEKSQSFALAQAPVAPGQRIVVREPERPPDDEVQRLAAEEGPDAIVVRQVAGAPDETWVRWHEVPTLAGSDEKSRHYTLDRIAGTLRFGDGVRGIVPPPGVDNVVAELYVAGGGEAGNRGLGAVSQPKSSIPYVAAVSNPVAADGGSAPESLDDVQLRGPLALRNAGRAVSEDDFESLARSAAGTRVARARTLPDRDQSLTYRPGWTTLIVVPRSRDPKPFPSAQLVRNVEDFFATRSAPALAGPTPPRLSVIGPGYLPVELAVEVQPRTPAEAAAVRTRVRETLDRFLHALTGGPGGGGWPFGRDVYLSEVFAELEAVPGVEHVAALAFRPNVATVPLRLPQAAQDAQEAGTSLVVTETAYGLGTPSPLTGPAVVGSLVEDLPAGGADAMVTVFQEGERVALAAVPSPLDGPQTIVRAISGDRLWVEPFRAPASFPLGTWVVTTIAPARGATLAAPVDEGALVETLVVAGLDLGGLGGSVGLGERLRVPPSHLVYSGSHTITATGA